MAEKCVRVARGLMLYGDRIRQGKLTRKEFLEEIGNVTDGSFRYAGGEIGATGGGEGLRFFDSTQYDRPQFGPSAGLVVGVSLGQQSLRAGLFDANGVLHHPFEDDLRPGQLEARPDEILERIRGAVDAVMTGAFGDPALLVEGCVPFMGVSVAWPCPVNRQKKPEGNLLRPGWRLGDPLDRRVAKAISIEPPRAHAINDTAAAAVAVAHRISTDPAHLEQDSSRLAIVLRLAGGVGGASIVVEGHREDSALGPTSGFAKSRLTGGVDHLAGEIGHAPVPKCVIEELNERTPRSLKKMKAHHCSCVGSDEPVPNHLEAYASGAAIARRVAPKLDARVVVERMLEDPDKPVHKRALEDMGTLVGQTMTGPAAMLNPASITLTGALAVPVVRDAVESRLHETHCYGKQPEVKLLPPDEDKFIRAKGAALVVLRRAVHRQIPAILGGPKPQLPPKVRALTVPFDEEGWRERRTGRGRSDR
jgi:predicted NBD/HSP70 family sugar kinase